MNIDLVKRAMGAAREVLLQECGMPVEQQQIKMQNGPYETKGVTVIIGLAQDVEGSIILGMSEETACAYISHAIGEPTTEIDELAQSGLGELGNVLAGRAAAKFCERGHQTAIAPHGVDRQDGHPVDPEHPAHRDADAYAPGHDRAPTGG